MASSYTASDLGTPKRITLSGTPNEATEIVFDERVRSVDVAFYNGSNDGVDGKIATTGTDGAAIGAAFLTAPADQRRTVTMARIGRKLGGFSLFVASATASAIAEVIGTDQVG